MRRPTQILAYHMYVCTFITYANTRASALLSSFALPFPICGFFFCFGPDVNGCLSCQATIYTEAHICTINTVLALYMHVIKYIYALLEECMFCVYKVIQFNVFRLVFSFSSVMCLWAMLYYFVKP